MHRIAENELIQWATQIPRMPLLLRGARQVGKTTLVRLFAQNQGFNLLEINFELMPKFKSCFKSLEPTDILVGISFLSQTKIEAGKTLLFLDEIQICPQAILALRYFKEKMPELHVIAAGSLLEFTLNQPDFRMPVGRVQSLYLKPLSFLEYLMASQPSENIDMLRALHYRDKIPEAIHQHLLETVKEYMIVGGMPEVVKYHLETRDYLMTTQLQGTILDNYRNDFGKYGIRLNLHLLQAVFERLPGLSGQHFKFSKLNLDAQSREIKPVLRALHDAGLAYSVHATHASGFPLSLGKSDKKFKLLFLDLGLMQHAQGLTPELLLGEPENLLHRGMLAEQFVGQELIAYQPSYEPASLFYWERDKLGSQAEIDYLIQSGSSIIPIEVKAGSTGRLKSLHAFMAEKNSRVGLHVSQSPLSHQGKILSIPLYLTWRLSELVAQAAADYEA
jgi:predicted AAA+ superfamily ATPase